MKNLEQMRAAAALRVAKHTTKADVNKLPAMILTNGLLAATSFANEKKDNGRVPKRLAMQVVMDGAAAHLAASEINIVPGATNAESLIDRLTNPNDCRANSIRLQRATAEALSFIGYVKRFATKEKSDSED